MRSDAKKNFLGILFGSLGLGSLVCYIFLNFPALTNGINNLVYDFWLTHMEPENPGNQVAIIDIDEASLKKQGQLPWPRSIIADLVSFLLDQGAAAIGLDIWLTEPDRTSPLAVDSLLEKNFGLTLDLSGIPVAALDNDRYLRNIIAGKPVVLGAYANSQSRDNSESGLPQGVKIKSSPDGPLLKDLVESSDGLIPPLDMFSSVAPIGILSMFPDTDGVVRAIPLLTRVGDNFYPAFSLRTLMAALKETEITAIGQKNGLTELEIGDYGIPVQADGTFRLVYRGKGRTLPFYSAADVLDGKIGREKLEGKILFIGTSAHTLNNLRSTPFDPEVPGAEIHATVVDNILLESSIRTPLWNRDILIVATYIAAICAVSAFTMLGLSVYAVLMSALLCVYIFGSWLLFQNGLFVSPAAPVITILLAGICIVPCRYWLEQNERRKLKLAFGRYVTPEIIDQIVNTGDQLLKGEQKQITVMFSDVRNFTAISERLDPQQLVRLLNLYFTPMTSCVTRHQGTLDKLIGDALMAFWNAPLDIEDHCAKAVLTALEMQDSVARMRPEFKKEFGVNLYIGIGLSTGLVHVGNMGSNELLDYTCIGETVNLASRLEGLCKRYGVGIVASASVRSACPENLKFLELDKVSVKGSARPISIYTPIGHDSDLDQKDMEVWIYALSTYFAGDFPRARREFETLADHPFLKKAAELFIKRCVNLKDINKNDWDGVWRYEEK